MEGPELQPGRWWSGPGNSWHFFIVIVPVAALLRWPPEKSFLRYICVQSCRKLNTRCNWSTSEWSYTVWRRQYNSSFLLKGGLAASPTPYSVLSSITLYWCIEPCCELIQLANWAGNTPVKEWIDFCWVNKLIQLTEKSGESQTARDGAGTLQLDLFSLALAVALHVHCVPLLLGNQPVWP